MMRHHERLSRFSFTPVAFALVAAVSGCGDRPALEPAPKGCPTCGDTVGAVRTDGAGYVEYTVGDAPLIISAPHGGVIAPASLPDRSCAGCVTLNDGNTQELARRVAAQFKDRTGRRPHLVINLLRRAKFDANRDVAEATGGNAALTPTWSTYHMFIESARGSVAITHGSGLLLDLHGHAHAIPRLELGYLLSAAALRLDDSALDASSAIASSSIARLSVVAVSRPSPAALLRGPASLGALLARNGFPAVPSPSDPAPAVDDEYFTGGYTTQRHGSSGGGRVDAVQIEANRAGVRDTPENLDRFAAAIVTSVLEFLSTHYGWVPPTVAMAPPWLPGAGRMAATLRTRTAVQRSVERSAQRSAQRSSVRSVP